MPSNPEFCLGCRLGMKIATRKKRERKQVVRKSGGHREMQKVQLQRLEVGKPPFLDWKTPVRVQPRLVSVSLAHFPRQRLDCDGDGQGSSFFGKKSCCTATSSRKPCIWVLLRGSNWLEKIQAYPPLVSRCPLKCCLSNHISVWTFGLGEGGREQPPAPASCAQNFYFNP